MYYILTHFGAILVRQLALFCIFNLAFYTAKHWVDHAQFDDVSSIYHHLSQTRLTCSFTRIGPALWQVLLEYDSHVDARDTRGGTPLHDAAQDEYLEVTLLLLKHGADANVQKGDRSAVLHVAAGEVVELLLT